MLGHNSPETRSFWKLKKRPMSLSDRWLIYQTKNVAKFRILEQKKREAQLNRYLDRFLIANAKITKIGSARKAVLASFGIETAADVERSKISAIQGFGPTLVAALMAWRQNLANKFVFNASEPINQNDLMTLRSRIANRRAELEQRFALGGQSSTGLNFSFSSTSETV